MAERRVVVVVCDLHRRDVEATHTLELALDGKRGKLDLCDEHFDEVRRALRPWLLPADAPPHGRLR